MVRHQSESRPVIPALSKLPAEPDLHDGLARRGAVRRPVNVRVEIEGKTDGAWALNLSVGGVRIVADVPLEVGEVVVLRLGDEPASGLHGRGRVVWVHRQGEDVVAGIQFLREAA
jgi:PilZ domain-containing protein